MLNKPRLTTSLTAIAAACMLAACGGGGGDDDSQSNNGGDNGGGTPVATTFSGSVASSAYVPGNASGNPTLKPTYFANATVFVDANGNGIADSDETTTRTDANGHFTLTTRNQGQLVADITPSATSKATGEQGPTHMILRASAAQIAEQGADKIVISPMSSEVQRLVEANGTDYATEKAALAAKLNGPAFNLGQASITAANVLSDVNQVGDAATQYALLYQDNMLANRYAYAAKKLDRGDMYPDNLAVAGGDPRVVDMPGVSKATSVHPAQTQTKITFAQSQQAAFEIEGIPAYDHIFIIMEENKSTDAVLKNPRAPFMNYLLSTYNQLSTYYSTGNPSEPNYTALGGGDDNGITDDSWWGCGAVGDYALKDKAFPGGVASDGQPLPVTGVLPPKDSAHLASYSATSTTCGDNPVAGAIAAHNVPGDNLFSLMSKAGLTVRTYNESMNPGQDARADSIADPAVTATYSEKDLIGQNGTITGTPDFAVVGGLYKVKHGPSIAYQSARNLPEFYADNRTIFGTQYDEAAWKNSSVYPEYDKSKWIYDQFGKDLDTGDVGNLNFIVPDQCDDMHGVGSDLSCANNNNGQAVGITRADIYLQKVVDRIQKSALWNNKNKRVAIIVMFDEGEGSSTACCGWNAAGRGAGAAPLKVSTDGKVTMGTAPTNYDRGNFGHGNSIFGVITNQQDVGTAKKGVVDSDAYSHFALVRTLQDMFQIGDPGDDSTYLNRAKYTEAFIAQNIMNLPEFAGSADTHFDSVRPINHAYVIPAGYAQKLNPLDISGVKDSNGNPVLDGVVVPQVGPDLSQLNIWAVK
ncbi:Phospholipase C [Bordetella ansorpii]|uniref:Phospholipase C n=1 Tax=Bordetella ansorpii TaxID=288768 RepID=A0A157S5Q5_9BORD|nr:alkaline phosphatase family protein [Bordetella ansorpii]SAI65603.1 Phospholipase C [Bordetella ansorpii]